MKVAILGGGGCFAINFANHLQALGIDHFGIGRSGPKAPAFWQVDGYYRYWKMHIVDEMAATLAVLDTEKPDVIVNFAAQGEGAASFGDNCADWYRTNVLGLVKIVSALARRQYLKRFIQIGSSEVYGGDQNNAKESDPLRPTSPYGVSKAAFDMHLAIMHRVHGLPANVVRPVNCYVRGQQLHRIIPKATLYAVGGKKLPLQGGGKSEKSFLHSTDLARALMMIIDKAPTGEVYNVGPLAPTAIREIVAAVAQACGVTFEALVEEAPERIGQDSRYWLDSTKLRSLGWAPSVTLEDGLEEIVRWVRAHPELQTADTEYRHRP